MDARGKHERPVSTTISRKSNEKPSKPLSVVLDNTKSTMKNSTKPGNGASAKIKDTNRVVASRVAARPTSTSTSTNNTTRVKRESTTRNNPVKPGSDAVNGSRKRKLETDNARNTSPSKVSQTSGTVTKRPKWDIKGKMADMENQITESQARVQEVQKSWQDLEDAVANKETESRQNNQRLMEIQTEEEVAKRRHAEAMDKLKEQHYLQNYALQLESTEAKNRAKEMQDEKSEIESRISENEQKLMQYEMENKSLLTIVSQRSASLMEAEAELHTMRLTVEQGDKRLSESQQKIDNLEAELAAIRSETKDMETGLLQAEKTRRRLHNTIQELKGNIRVFCRVRPPLESEKNLAQMRFYGEDGEKLELSEEISSTLGRTTTKTYPFSFDKVFPPHCTQQDCYEEISQLVQSALDGYNVCIFAYGQTGSGKTYTMQGPSGANNKESAGMIPRAVQQIYDVAQKLSERNWKYTMEGQFLEIYNETVHDLLGDTANYGKIKHEIRHDKNGRTTVTDMTSVILDSPSKVNSMLRRASQNRATGATNLNERSSRSHSVFMLRLTGSNAVTGEHCSGVLNLIDLAGSERLALSGSTGDRLRETQAINRSLSCLGDVIHALATNNKDTGHVPYRNSKLTYLLQNSLGGNSKTLMFVNISPLSEHFGETLCSLRFATKVNSCRIGTARRNVK